MDAQVGALILSSIMQKKFYASHDYFCRVWTLAERMARHGRDEDLGDWLALETWIGMVLDVLICCAPQSVGARLIGKIFRDKKFRPLLEELDLLRNAVPDAKLIHRVAQMFVTAVQRWATVVSTSKLAEAPTLEWLNQYLKRNMLMYDAFYPEDKVWAVYSYFCTDGGLLKRENKYTEAVQRLREQAARADILAEFRFRQAIQLKQVCRDFGMSPPGDVSDDASQEQADSSEDAGVSVSICIPNDGPMSQPGDVCIVMPPEAGSKGLEQAQP